MKKQTKRKNDFFKEIVTRLIQNRPVSERLCNAYGYTAKTIYNILRTQTNLYVRLVSFRKGDYIFLDDCTDMVELSSRERIEEYLENEMLKHELAYNEVKF